MDVNIIDKEKNISCDISNTDKPCSPFLELIPYISLMVLQVVVAKLFLDKEPVEWHFSIFSYFYGGLCMFWWGFILFERTYYYGIAGFYEIYWFCNMGLFMTGVGVMLRMPNVIGQSMCLLLLPHLTFWIDLIFRPIFKKSLIGSFDYLFDKETPLHEKVSSSHHLWYFPLLLFVFYGQPPISIICWPMAVLIFACLNFFSHYMTPLYYPQKDGLIRELNICCSHIYPGIAKHVPPFKWVTGNSYFVFLLVAVVFYNVPVNLIAYLIIVGIQMLILKFL